MALPTISWEGGGAVRLAIIDEEGSGGWWVGSGNYTDPSFYPPVTYGEVPKGVTASGEAYPLEKDMTYTVIVNLSSGETLTAEWVYK